MKSLPHDCRKRLPHDRTMDQNGDLLDLGALVGRCAVMQVGRRRYMQIVFLYPFLDT